jgi:FKBP-type peptidyl-prolyl cis-trans isomerase FkpA
MKNFGILMIAALVLLSCGGKKEATDEVVELKDFKDRLSYVLGSINAQSIVGQPDQNIARLDMDLIAKGFEANLNDNMPSDCQQTLEKLFGPYYQDFDSTYAAPGAECLGKLTAYSFYREMKEVGALDKIDLKMTVTGFRHGLLKKDTLISEQEKKEIFGNFIKDIEKVMQKKNEEAGKKMLEDAKKIPGAKVFDNGIVIQELRAGKGGSPAATDDVKIDYILISALGDTLQSSYEMRKMTQSKDAVSLNLAGVVPGWTFALPKMKKGGKYKLYVPWQLAYGEQGMYNPQTQSMDIKPFESLCFVIEMIDYAKKGTFVKPQTEMQMPDGMQ